MLIAYSGDAVAAQDLDPLFLIKFTAINHADVDLIYSEESVSPSVGDEEDEQEAKMCQSNYLGLSSYTCDELRTYAKDGLFMTQVSIAGGDPDDITLSLARLDCDLGCGCGFDLSEQVWPNGDEYDTTKISSCYDTTAPSDYYRKQASDRAYVNGILPSTCPIHSSKTCGTTMCGDVALKYGQVAMMNDDALKDCDCCVPTVTCGEYEPFAENLHLRPLVNMTITRDDASLYIAGFDILYCMVFMIFWKLMSSKVAVVIRQTDEDNVTAGDYTIRVTGLPLDADEESIRKHFSDLYQLSSPDWSFKGYICGIWGKKKPREPDEILGYDLQPMKCEPVNNVDMHGKENYIGSWVADVNIAHPNGSLIRRCQALKKYSNKLLEARAMVKKYSPGTPLKGGTNPRLLKKAEKKLSDCENKISKIHKSLKSSAASFQRIDNECMAAFVTFENEDSLIRCLDDYQRYGGRSFFNPFTWLKPPVPKILMFREKHYLKITTSPEPSNILWENLETSSVEGTIRKTITSIITLSMLLISLALVIIVQTSKEAVAKEVPDLSKCPSDIPAAYNMTHDTVEYLWLGSGPCEAEDSSSWCDEDVCGTNGGRFITITGFEGMSDETTLEEAKQVKDKYDNSCQDPCVPDDSSRLVCTGYTGNEQHADSVYDRIRSFSYTKSNGDVITEYKNYADCPNFSSNYDECTANFQEIVDAEPGTVWSPKSLACDDGYTPDFVMSENELSDRKNCVEYQKKTVMGCFCVNIMIDIIATEGVFDGSETLMNEYAVCETFAQQYTIAQFLVVGAAGLVTVINVVLKATIKGMASFEHHASLSEETKAISSQIAITLFVNTAIIIMAVNAYIEFDVLNAFGLLQGTADDFDFSWYVNVGTAIITTMVINAITPHMSPLLGYYVLDPLKRTMASVAATQRSLNKKFEGPEFEISTRFPMILNALSVTLVFSSALPVLLPIAFVACQFFYHVDKFLLLRYYKTPPAYDAKLAAGTVHLLPAILVVHCMLSTWVYSQSDVFQSTCVPVVIDTFSSYLETGSEYDSMDIIPRMLKRNTFPMFVFTILVIILVVYSYLGHWIIKAIVGGALSTVFNIILFPFKKCYQLCCGKALVLDKEFNPPYSKDFVRGYAKGISVPGLSHAAGWELNKDENGFSVHTKVWKSSGEQAGIRHTEGANKRTWESIRDSQVHSYNIRHNKRYTDAMIAKDELTAALGIIAGQESAVGGASTPGKKNSVVPVA